MCLYLFECVFYAESKYSNENLNFENFWQNVGKFQPVVCTRQPRGVGLCFPRWLQVSSRKVENFTIFSKNPRRHLKNYWTNTKLVCTHLNAFFMLNQNMAMKIFQIYWKMLILFLVSSAALDTHVEMVKIDRVGGLIWSPNWSGLLCINETITG